MGQHVSGAEDAFLLIQNGTQQNIGVDQTLHQDVCLAILTQFHSPTGTFFLVVAIDVDGFDKSHLLTFFYSIAGTCIIGTYHCYTFTVTPLLQEDDHVV